MSSSIRYWHSTSDEVLWFTVTPYLARTLRHICYNGFMLPAFALLTSATPRLAVALANNRIPSRGCQRLHHRLPELIETLLHRTIAPGNKKNDKEVMNDMVYL